MSVILLQLDMIKKTLLVSLLLEIEKDFFNRNPRIYCFIDTRKCNIRNLLTPCNKSFINNFVVTQQILTKYFEVYQEIEDFGRVLLFQHL